MVSGREEVLEYKHICGKSEKAVYFLARRMLGLAEHASPISLALLYIGSANLEEERERNEVMPCRSDWKHKWYGYTLQCVVGGTVVLARQRG